MTRSSTVPGAMRWLRAGATAVVAALTLIPAAIALPDASAASAASEQIAAPAAGTTPAPAAAKHAPPPGTYRITLITGDQVELRADATTSEASVVSWARHPGRTAEPRYQTFAGPDGIFVIPDDVQPMIDSGRLDRTLFDVAYLAANGYTDAQSAELPVLVDYPVRARAATSEPALRAAADALPASRTTAVLSSIGAAGLAVSKSGTAAFWLAVSRSQGAARSADSIEKVWLDRPVRASLNESVPLIGAPEAWSAGYDGTGVTVAVLDTGIDENHPDLRGKVATSKSFMGGTVRDGHGHGTHVAATIAGAGDGAGRYRGVAPAARLAVGKVLGDDGKGSIAGIIDGMEWAAQEAGADIVSMSLGTDPTDGTDPASQAVNALTASTGALFVIAAGNTGPRAGTVGSPGVADAALTVGATDKQDQLAPFSSRGPRLDSRLKPDITAPGVAIVAARAAGTTMGTPVNDLYTRANGTSMATPHVAGAAAILVQQHPDWPPAAVKAALMSTSRAGDGSVYEHGAGRVDVARAVRQKVVATTAALDFGLQSEDASEPVRRQVEYRNSGSAPVTLSLTPSLRTTGGQAVPAGSLTADATVTVPAGGSATATVTLASGGLDLNHYTGALTATDPAAGVTVTTPVGLVVEPRTVALTIRTLDRAGEPADDRSIEQGGSLGGFTPHRSIVTALNVAGVDGVDTVTPVDRGVERARVRPGIYTVRNTLRWWDDAQENYVTGMLIDAQVEVTEDTEIVLDARQAKPITWSLPHAGTGPSHTYLSIDLGIWDKSTVHSTAYAEYITPTEPVTANTFRVGFKREEYRNTQVSMTLKGGKPVPVPVESRHHADRGLVIGSSAAATVETPGGWVPFPAGKRTLQLVDAGFGDPDDLAGVDLRGKLALVRWGDGRHDPDIPTSVIYTDRIDNLRKAGAIGFVAFADPPGEQYARHASFASPTTFFQHWAAAGPKEITIPELQVKRAVGRDLLARTERGPVFVEVTSDPEVRWAYHAHVYQRQQIGADPRFVLTDRDFARVDNRLHSSTEPSRVRMYAASLLPGTTFYTSRDTVVASPRTAFTEYFGPLAEDVTWLRRTDSASRVLPDQRAEPRAYNRHATHTEDWNTGVITPGQVVLRDYDSAAHPAPGGVGLNSKVLACTLCRQGNAIVPIRGTVDADGHYGEGMVDKVALFDASGTSIPLSRGGGIGWFDVPPTTARYTARLVEDGVDTRWSFTSAPVVKNLITPERFCLGPNGITPPCGAHPLVNLAYDFTDSQRLDNSLPVRPVQRFAVRAWNGGNTEPMPAVKGLKLWTSIDGGTTWRPALVVPRAGAGGDRWFDVVAITGGRAGARLSLKAEAWDAAGNRIEQVLTDRIRLS